MKKQKHISPQVEVVIEAPRGSHAKYKYDEKKHVFTLHKILPSGAVFPYNFGFLPDTTAEDGDPLDVLVLTEVTAFPGCVIPARLIGVLEAEQSEKAGTSQEPVRPIRNDRLIAIAEADPIYKDIRSPKDLSDALLQEIAHFFISYNEPRGVTFTPLGYHSAEAACALVEKGKRKEKQKSKESKAA